MCRLRLEHVADRLPLRRRVPRVMSGVVCPHKLDLAYAR